MTTASCNWLRCCARRRTRFTGRAIDDPKELADGFPTTSEELFDYQAIVIGSVEANYFTPQQQELIHQFVDRRGGGLLLLGGQFSLADGGWAASGLADLLPVMLPGRKGTFHRDHATPMLTPAGAESVICRLSEDPAKNADRWKKLPYLMDYQDPGTPKPGAEVLAEMMAGGRKMPLLITQNYGRGRTAVLATGGTWRWQMSLPLGDTSHDDFWRQLLRWMVADTPGRVVASVPSQCCLTTGACSSRPTCATRIICRWWTRRSRRTLPGLKGRRRWWTLRRNRIVRACSKGNGMPKSRAPTLRK